MRNKLIAFGLLISSSALLGAQGSSARAARLLVLNKDDATLAIVDPESSSVLARVPTGEGPHEMTVSPDGATAFVSNYGAQTPGSTLSAIDLAARKERRIDLGPLRRPHGIAFADGKVYFTAEVNRLVARYDPASNKVDWLLGTGQATTHMVLVNRDATRMFTSNIGSDSVTVIDRGANPSAWNETVIPVGKGPEGIDISPDGKEVWSAHSRDGAISVIDTSALKVVATIDVHTKRSNRVKFTPDGRLALVSDIESGEIVVVDTHARKETKRIAVGKSPEGVLIPPEGGRAYIAVNGDNNIAVIDLATLAVVKRIETGKGPDGMAWVAR